MGAKLGLRVRLRDLLAVIRAGRGLRERARFLFEPHIARLVPDASWSVLVIAPHPDDEAIWCGGIVRRVVEAGGRVDCVFLTDGERHGGAGRRGETPGDGIAARRREESARSCALLGISRVERFGARDGTLRDRLDLSLRLARLLAEGAYTHVLCPWAFDWHPDHAAAFHILERAVREAPGERAILLYEAWGTLSPNAAIDIDAVLAAKQRAIAAHESQAELDDFVALGTALSRYRAMCLPGAVHAEAFFLLPSSKLRWLGLGWGARTAQR